jgi:hypothetical protein
MKPGPDSERRINHCNLLFQVCGIKNHEAREIGTEIADEGNEISIPVRRILRAWNKARFADRGLRTSPPIIRFLSSISHATGAIESHVA